MSKNPNNLYYTKSHEWVRLENDIAVIGITDHAQHQMGDLVFVELPKINRAVSTGDEIAVVESVKTAADVYAPLSGMVVETNQQLNEKPELVNQDPYGSGWICQLKISNKTELNQLLNASDYEKLTTQE